MKLAKQIVATVEKKYGNAPYEDGTLSLDLIVADAEEWESIIAAKLDPIREAVEVGFEIAKGHNSDGNYAEEVNLLQSALTLLSGGE